jgi:hypothetical protein
MNIGRATLGRNVDVNTRRAAYETWNLGTNSASPLEPRETTKTLTELNRR